MDYKKFLTTTSLKRKINYLRITTNKVAEATFMQENSTLISMASGMPNPQCFPLLDASLTLRDGTHIELDALAMKTALQYLGSKGLPSLINFVNEIQLKAHNPPTYKAVNHPGQMDTVITCGSQDGICKIIESMVAENDSILMEHPAYPGTIAIVKPLTSNTIPVDSDNDGLNPSCLRQALSKWSPSEAREPGSGAPKLLYLIPNGGNPTGAGLTLERKKEIYKLAQEYDLIILEDDPYFYLQFTKPRVPSFLSMDTDGRVVRCDSFSKLISSGMRVGFVTGPRPLLERIELHLQCSVMHASGIAQMILSKVLENWGLDGFFRHAEDTAEFYKTKRDQCLSAMEKHLSGLAQWSVPSGGMFVWIKLNVEDTYKLITIKAREKEILFVPGNVFMLDSTKPCSYIRASYSNCTEEQMDIAFSRLAELLREG